MNDLEGFIVAIRTLGESIKVAYDSFIKAGFNEFQAITLASNFMEIMLTQAQQNGGGQ